MAEKIIKGLFIRIVTWQETQMNHNNGSNVLFTNLKQKHLMFSEVGYYSNRDLTTILITISFDKKPRTARNERLPSNFLLT